MDVQTDLTDTIVALATHQGIGYWQRNRVRQMDEERRGYWDIGILGY